MNGDLPFLNEEGFSDEAEPQAEAAELSQEAQVKQPEAQEEPKGEATPAPPAGRDEEGKSIPISALLDEREKRQARERELEELRRKLGEYEKPKTPDFYEDPEGRLAQEQQAVRQMLWNERLNTSEMVAREKFGDEAVVQAQQAFAQAVATNPSLYAEMQSQANPYGYVMQWHKRSQAIQKMGDDPEAYIEAQVKARLEQMQAAQPKPSTPPPSLASAAALGGDKAPPASGFDQLFGG